MSITTISADLLTHIVRSLNQTERILLATGLTASTDQWQSRNWNVALSEQSIAILSIEYVNYPVITKFTLPAVAGISAYEIAAALGCINARTHLMTLEVPGETVYNNIEAVDAYNNLGAGFMTPLVGSSVLVNLDLEHLHGQNIEKSRLVDMLEILVCSINTAERTDPLQITFPHDWVQNNTDRRNRGIPFGFVHPLRNYQVLLRRDSMLEDFIEEYKAHRTRYAAECRMCSSDVNLPGQEDAQAGREPNACTYCFRIVCRDCLEIALYTDEEDREGEFDYDFFASKCAHCGVMICGDCQQLPSTVQSCNNNRCRRTICSLCLPNEEPAMTLCDGVDCDAYVCSECCDLKYKINDRLENESITSWGENHDDHGETGYMISCTECDQNFCAGCNGNILPVICGNCESEYCQQCALNNGTLRRQVRANAYDSLVWTKPPCTQCGRQACSNCESYKACSLCETVLCHVCVSESMVTLPDGTTNCTECTTQCTRCTICDHPMILDDMADGDHHTVCQECLDSRMEVASDGLTTCSNCFRSIVLDVKGGDIDRGTVCPYCFRTNLEVASDDGM